MALVSTLATVQRFLSATLKTETTIDEQEKPEALALILLPTTSVGN